MRVIEADKKFVLQKNQIKNDIKFKDRLQNNIKFSSNDDVFVSSLDEKSIESLPALDIVDLSTTKNVSEKDKTLSKASKIAILSSASVLALLESVGLVASIVKKGDLSGGKFMDKWANISTFGLLNKSSLKGKVDFSSFVSSDKIEKTAHKLETATSGYRAKLEPEGDETFSDRLVSTITNAYLKYLKDNGEKTVYIGGDTREATIKYQNQIADFLRQNGIVVGTPKLSSLSSKEHNPVATPALAVVSFQNKANSILLTASHNPWQDGGYNFLTKHGAVAEEEFLVPLANNMRGFATNSPVFEKSVKTKSLNFDPYKAYSEYLNKKQLVDFDLIKSANMDIFYEDLCGTGGYYFPKLLEERGVKLKAVLHTKTKGPNPDKENLKTLSSNVISSPSRFKIGLANDGDSDRFGFVDEKGSFISPNDIITLVAYHMIKNKGIKEGTILKSQATTGKLEALAKYFNSKPGYDIKVEDTPVGFKYLGKRMMQLENTKKAAIVAGEESGGLTIRGHIPEKDGFVADLMILELMAKENKPVSEILNDVNNLIGGSYQTISKNLKFASEDEKMKYYNKMLEKFASAEEVEGLKVDKIKTFDAEENIKEYRPQGDGKRLFFEDGSSVLLRLSGTEPLVRIYINATNEKSLGKIQKFVE